MPPLHYKRPWMHDIVRRYKVHSPITLSNDSATRDFHLICKLAVSIGQKM